MMTPSKWRAPRFYRRALTQVFILVLTTAAWAQTKPSDNPSTPTEATTSNRKVELLRDRPLLEQRLQNVATNEQEIAPNRQQIELNSPVGTAVGKCPSGQTSCSGVCTDTNTNLQNCGSCGHACGTGTSCVSGACVQNLLTNGSACQTGSQCSSGSCSQGVCCNVSCGSCSNGTLQACNLAGSVGTCSTVSCPSGFACSSSSSCSTTCSSDANCTTAYYCNTPISACVMKKPSGVACTGNNQCSSGNCVGSVCQ